MTRPTDVVIDATTPLGFRVTVVRSAWEVIVTLKHPDMLGREKDVELALAEPDEVRFSVSRRSTLLFYRSSGQGTWVVAVTKRDGREGYLVTAYESQNIKSGGVAWQK
jgi:hypothetical protein